MLSALKHYVSVYISGIGFKAKDRAYTDAATNYTAITNPMSPFPSNGTVIAWRVYAGCSSCNLYLQVWRPLPIPGKYELIGVKHHKPPASRAYQFIQLMEHEFVQVTAGDLIGMSFDYACIPWDPMHYGTNEHCVDSRYQIKHAYGAVPKNTGTTVQLATYTESRCRAYSFNAVLL